MTRRSVHIMLVGAHPSDCFDQAGGTLAHHVARGDQVTVVATTIGVRSHHNRLINERIRKGTELDMEERVKEGTREKLEELRNACQILGFDDVRTLLFEDDDILVTQDKIEAIAEMIREVKPDILITHHPFEGGGLKMHATVGQASMYGWQLAMGTGRKNQAHHYVPLIYYMNPTAYIGHNSLGYAGTSAVYIAIDITDVIEKKVKAIDCISSQYYGGAWARKIVETEDGKAGQLAHVAYAERFQCFMPMRRYTLPVTESDLVMIGEEGDVTSARRGEMVAGLMQLPPDSAKFTSRHRIPKEKYYE